MYIDLNSRKHRRNNLFIEITNIILGIAIIVLAVLTFLDTEQYVFLFPVIFLLGTIMNGLTALKYILGDNTIIGIIMTIIAIILLMITVGSGIVVWR